VSNNLPDFTGGDEGVFYDMPDEVYRKSPGVSNSMLKAISSDGEDPGSPAHFLAQFSYPQEDTDALFMGRYIHSRILTPDAPLPGIVEIPDTYPAPANCSAVKQKKVQPGDPLPWHGAATYCKQWEADQVANGNRPMKAADIEKIDGVVNAIAAHPTCKVIFENGTSEVSLFKRYHNGNGMILRKARLDWVPPGTALVDVKTCLDARAVKFARTLWNRRYFVQAAIYLTLWNELNPHDQKTNFVFVAVEKFAPYGIQIFDVSQEDIRAGNWEWRRNLALVIECMKRGEWPAYPTETQTIKMQAPYGTALIN
jgi:hypothetical protein